MVNQICVGGYKILSEYQVAETYNTKREKNLLAKYVRIKAKLQWLFLNPGKKHRFPNMAMSDEKIHTVYIIDLVKSQNRHCF